MFFDEDDSYDEDEEWLPPPYPPKSKTATHVHRRYHQSRRRAYFDDEEWLPPPDPPRPIYVVNGKQRYPHRQRQTYYEDTYDQVDNVAPRWHAWDTRERENVSLSEEVGNLKQQLEEMRAQILALTSSTQHEDPQAVLQPTYELVVDPLYDVDKNKEEEDGVIIKDCTPALPIPFVDPLYDVSFEEDKEKAVINKEDVIFNKLGTINPDNNTLMLLDYKFEPPDPRFVFLVSNNSLLGSPLLFDMPPKYNVNGLDGMVDKLTGDTISMYYKCEPPDPEFVIVMSVGLPPIQVLVHKLKEYRRHQPSSIHYRYLVSCLVGTFNNLHGVALMMDYKSEPPDSNYMRPVFKSRVSFQMFLLSFPTVQTRTFHSQEEENDTPPNADGIRISG